MGDFTRETFNKLRACARTSVELLQPTEMYTGMALGWDHACLLAAFDLGVPVVACLPFEGMESKWQPRWRDWFRKQLDRVTRVHVCCGSESRGAYQVRNEYMADHAQHVLALWDGGYGGTANCVRYATGEIPTVLDRGRFIADPKPVSNVWPDWIASYR